MCRDDLILPEDARREDFFDEAIAMAKALTSTLDGAQNAETTSLTTFLEDLKRERVELPDTLHPVPLDTTAFVKNGVDLGIDLDALSKTHNFYALRVPLILFPKVGQSFHRVRCRLRFGPTASPDRRPIAISMFPSSQYGLLAKAGLDVSVGLNEALRFTPTLPQGPALTASAKGAASATLTFAIPLREYSLKQAIVVAAGEGTNTLDWRFDDAHFLAEGRPQIALVLQVPRTIDRPEGVKAIGELVAYHSFDWLSARLGDLFSYLTEQVRTWFARGAPATHAIQWNLNDQIL